MLNKVWEIQNPNIKTYFGHLDLFSISDLEFRVSTHRIASKIHF